MVYVAPRHCDRLTDDQYNGIVDRWNKLNARQRRERLAECADGHDFAEAPFSTPDKRTYLCRRCCRYDARNRP